MFAFSPSSNLYVQKFKRNNCQLKHNEKIWWKVDYYSLVSHIHGVRFSLQKITIRSNRVWIVHSRIDELTGCRKRREFNVIFHFVHTFHSTRSIKNWNYCVIVTKSGKTENKNWKMRKQQISLMPCHGECKNCVCTIRSFPWISSTFDTYRRVMCD